MAESEAALRLEPQNYEFRFNYALLLARQAEAIAQFEAVLRLKPDLEPAREQLARLRLLQSP